jgi:poly(3-hydroxybutyrate) depolymerase
VHGTADKIIRYDGGTGSMFGYKVTAKSVADTIQYWVKRDQCNVQPIHEVKGNARKLFSSLEPVNCRDINDRLCSPRF